MADRALTPATRRRLGEPLPHQLPDRPRDPPEPPELFRPDHAIRSGHSALAPVSRGYSKVRGRFLTCYSPVRRFPPPEGGFVPRLACVKPAASVHPEPGSNSPLREQNHLGLARMESHDGSSLRGGDCLAHDPRTVVVAAAIYFNSSGFRQPLEVACLPPDGAASHHCEAALAFGTLCSSQGASWSSRGGFCPSRGLVGASRRVSFLER